MEDNKLPSSNTITFLGTAGARFMVAKQLAASGGLWVQADGTQLLIDPGPGCLVHAIKRNFRADQLSGIIISHRHLDHSSDVNIMVEAMTEGGFNQRGWFFAPSDALDDEPVLFSYLRKYLSGVTILEEGGSYAIGDITFSTPVRHIHSVETYGLKFKLAGCNISYIADSHYFEGLCENYQDEVVIINMVLMQSRSFIDHLSVDDVAELVSCIKPKLAVLTHFGMGVWKAHPREIAKKLTEKTGINVLAAYDGMELNLDRLAVSARTC